MKKWLKSGEPWIWLNAGAVSISVIAVVGLLALIAVRGLAHFWPAHVEEMQYRNADGSVSTVVGEVRDQERISGEMIKASGVKLAAYPDSITRYLIKIGNRDVEGLDFRWLLEPRIEQRRQPVDLLVVERREWGNFYGYLDSVIRDGVEVKGEGAAPLLDALLERALDLHEQIKDIEKYDTGAVNYELERLRLKRRGLELKGQLTPEAISEIEAQKTVLNSDYQALQEKLITLYKAFRRDAFVMRTGAGQRRTFSLASVVRLYRPNGMDIFDQVGFYFMKIGEFVADDPREANTEGGIFPAIFGTVMMVMLMAVLVTPFGVIAAVYLHEYAKQGFVTRLIRIAVNNLASVPSIVYGVFGLGFFVYFLGGNIDELFFPEALPSPTFGTPGLMWSSLTLALMTLPVVIVATEEGLSRIPSSIREGSLALGATKIETLWRTVLPMSSPAIMTGLILAVARAAGEVAPLMLVGVVKLAPTLPLDMNAPFLHLERKFMHLGFHIYDVGFQSPNVEAARPLVYATALLLVVVIITLNLSAIFIRNRLREKYHALEN